MDSLTQAALGAAIGLAVMGRRTRPWKAAAAGALIATLPDLDAFYDYGDPVSNMTYHRSNTHALFWQSLASLPIAFAVAKALREMHQFGRWWLTVWLALVTHALLDWMTAYGTQLGLPFTDTPFAVGSMPIIDPLYTLLLLIGIVVALSLRSVRGWRWNAATLLLSTAYLGWSVGAQTYVKGIAERSLRAQNQQVERLLVIPTMFNTMLWRIVAVTPEGYLEGFYALLDREKTVAFDRYPRGEEIYKSLRGNWHVDRVAWFSRGFFKMSERDGQAIITDLRMGQTPKFSFSFVVAERQNSTFASVTPQRLRERPDFRSGVAWLWRRMGGEPLPPPQ